MAQRGVLAFTDPQELEARIEEYFASRWETRTIKQRDREGNVTEFEEPYMRPPTMAGLALALGVTRVTLLHYGKGEGSRDERFIPILARAKTRIAEFAEEALYTKEAATGARFALEVNHRYGREDEGGGTGDTFQQNLITPAESGQMLAIPLFNPTGDDEDD